MNKISIIIPVLNEAETIENLLFHLIDCSALNNISEIIVVDGGSTDGTIPIIKNLGLNIKVLNSEKGRAKQMNLGASEANGNILYFLHADSFPPNRYDQLILSAIENGNASGCFKMKFDSNHWWLKLASWFTQFNWQVCRGGDQSLFITHALFKDIGGFDENFTIYEDNDFISKLYQRKQFVVLQDWLTTSARKYNNHGICKLQFHFWAIHLKKRLGASPEKLNHYYLKHIAARNS